MRPTELSIDVEGPIDVVWRALTTGEGLEAWYVTKAAVEPRLGGRATVWWGAGPSGTTEIDVWEPPTRVRFKYLPEGGMEIDKTLPGVGSEEWILDHEAGTTRVRLIHSLPDPGVDDWDEYFGDLRRGWTLFMWTMKHYVEVAKRAPRTTDLVTPPVADPQQAYTSLAKLLGLETLAAGDTFSVNLRGEPVGVTVLVAIPPHSLLVDAAGTLLLADIEGSKPDRVFYGLASTFGPDSEAHRSRRSALLGLVSQAAG